MVDAAPYSRNEVLTFPWAQVHRLRACLLYTSFRVLGEEAKLAHLLRNFARGVDHDLMRLFLAQERIHGSYRFIVGFNLTLIALGVAGVLPPTTSALLHNGSTLGISLRNMTDLLNDEENTQK